MKTLTYDKWQDYHNKLITGIGVDLKLPRFETSSEIYLKKIMSALGMPNAFDQNLAEFPNFCTTPTFIDMMKQGAKIKLDETGAEAAAVTAISSADCAKIPFFYATFHADRPFFYIIYEQSTNAIFFIGQYTGE